MENLVKYSVKYLIGVVALLLILAAVFFGLANKKPAFDSDYVMQLIDDNKSLTVKLQAATSKNTEYESTITVLNQTIEENVLKTSLDAQDTISTEESLLACVVPDDVLEVQQRLIDMQGDYIACTNDLSNTKSELGSLAQTNENLQDTLNDSQLVEFEARVLEDQLATANSEYSDLESRFNQLLQQNQELVNTIGASGPLAFSSFTLVPSYCAEQLDPELVCVDSIDIDADFNFEPSSNITVRLVNPMGEIIGRKIVSGREQNRIQFRTDTTDPMLFAGQYKVEFRIEGEFSDDRSFEIARP